MISVRRSEDRGLSDLGWLQAQHSFSFSKYYDAQHMGFRVLRVINEDRVRPSSGFPMHGHRNMEIVTYVISGALEHRDSLGNKAIIGAGEIQCMSAGTGVRHSEVNHSSEEELHLLQIWLRPARSGGAPSYQQQSFRARSKNELHLLVSPDGRDESLLINQRADVFGAKIDSQAVLSHLFADDRYGWLQLIKGGLNVETGRDR